MKQQLWGGELWNDGYFVRRIGDKVRVEVIREDIRHQYDPKQLELEFQVLNASQRAAVFFTELESSVSALFGVKADLVMQEMLKPRIGQRICIEVMAL